MRRAAIVVAIALVVVGIGLLLWLRERSGPEPASASASAPDPKPLRAGSGSGAGSDADAGADADAGFGGSRVVTRKSGGVVRDHRSQPAAVDPSSTPRVPLENAPVDPRLILELRERLRPIVTACSRDHAADVSDGAQLRQRVGVAISGERLRVTELSARASGISGSAVADCVAEKAKQIELRADGHEDVRHHMLTFPFRLPAK